MLFYVVLGLALLAMLLALGACVVHTMAKTQHVFDVAEDITELALVLGLVLWFIAFLMSLADKLN